MLQSSSHRLCHLPAGAGEPALVVGLAARRLYRAVGPTRDVLAPSVSVCTLPSVDESPPDVLDDRSRSLLDFERESWKLQVPKERAIRERFGFSATRYHQLLNRLIEEPAALAYDPMLVRRLQRVREARRQRRVARQLGVRV